MIESHLINRYKVKKVEEIAVQIDTNQSAVQVKSINIAVQDNNCRIDIRTNKSILTKLDLISNKLSLSKTKTIEYLINSFDP